MLGANLRRTLLSSPSQLESPDVIAPSAGNRNSNNEINFRMGSKEKTDQTFMKVSFERYVSQIITASEQEAHEQRLKKLADEAKFLQKTEWMFSPIEKLLGNWVQ